ncbi:GMC family oxidoreductase [Niallia oryzisoli]|uniref:GMC family oxidoreductase n=1 Tax=Niallia oryzisoli TaxID=1737571 RepID=A0ABZ2CNT0_9BACI
MKESLWSLFSAGIFLFVMIFNHFKQLEKFQGENENPKFHGYKGRINIRQAPVNPTNVSEKFVSAIVDATGVDKILDYNDPTTPIGAFTQWQLYQKPYGQREGSSTAFLSPDILTPDGLGENERKLRVFYYSTVLRILFEGRRAVGVELLKEGKMLKVYARKKVIISAGINSPQLLMFSGIGPVRELQQAGIPIVFNNPNVGKNVTNHTLNTAIFSMNQRDMADLQGDPFALYTGGAFLPHPFSRMNGRRSVQLIGTVSEGNLIIVVIFLQPRSRGTIRIQNNDPLKIVLADEGFLDNPFDMETIKAIFRMYIKPMAMKLSTIDSAYQLLNPTIDTIDNDEALEEYIKENFGHNHHQQGFLRMAPFSRGGVVDNQGRVHGVDHLIVADASIIPFSVDGNTSAAAYLIGYTVAKNLMQEE